jgi:hypothetical protein
MKWATRRRPHVDRAACAWLIKRFVDPEAEFLFVDDADEVPPDVTPFDMRGAELSHRGGHCTFETLVRHYRLDDPAVDAIARIVHEADLRDELYDAPEAPGLDAIVAGLSAGRQDAEVLAAAAPLFDALYAHLSREEDSP